MYMEDDAEAESVSHGDDYTFTPPRFVSWAVDIKYSVWCEEADKRQGNDCPYKVDNSGDKTFTAVGAKAMECRKIVAVGA